MSPHIPPETGDGPSKDGLNGTTSALLAFSIWGGIPLYFKAVASVPPLEVLSHRILWTAAFVGLIIVLMGKTALLRRVFADKKLLKTLLLSSFLVSSNWLIFIWAIANDRVLESSLGYYINPLVSIALGMVFFKERLNARQWLAVLLAVCGVAVMLVRQGQLPWVSLALAFSFGFYGLVRKIAAIDALSGLFVETVLLLPPVFAYLVYIAIEGGGALGRAGPRMDVLLILAGVVTATPLILFTHAARRLALSKLGLLQYIVPTGHFLLAVYVFGEPFTTTHLVTFALIWLALAVYSADGAIKRRKETTRP